MEVFWATGNDSGGGRAVRARVCEVQCVAPLTDNWEDSVSTEPGLLSRGQHSSLLLTLRVST